MVFGDGRMAEGKIIRSLDTERANRVPPHQIVTEKFPVLQYGGVPKIDVSKWTFRIWGLVEKERKLSYEEFRALPEVKVFSDVHCVTGWSKLDNTWEGVSTQVIKGLVRILPEAKFVIVHCNAGFTTNLSLDDFFEPDVLFAVKHDGEPLTPEHGYPLRLVVPRLYFWKSAKWVEGVEFTAKDRKGFWESRGYHNHGDPWQEERYS
jgi:DMSO/TMAO reductase YedYZ molybdopterin-dependent catalytic subunit